MYSSLSVQRRLLAVSTVLDNCAWAVSNVHVDLPTLANWRLCNVYAQKRLSPRLTSSLHVSFFSQFMLPPFIACIELVSLGSEAIATYHVAVSSNDDILRKFWEVEENPKDGSALSSEERTVVQHFRDNHTRNDTGRFVVPLPKGIQGKPLGESLCVSGTLAPRPRPVSRILNSDAGIL